MYGLMTQSLHVLDSFGPRSLVFGLAVTYLIKNGPGDERQGSRRQMRLVPVQELTHELTACKQQACRRAHNHSLYLYFVLNQFLFKPRTRGS